MLLVEGALAYINFASCIRLLSNHWLLTSLNIEPTFDGQSSVRFDLAPSDRLVDVSFLPLDSFGAEGSQAGLSIVPHYA